MNLIDLVPTFLEWTGAAISPAIQGKSLLPFLKGETSSHRQEIFVERERHAYARAGNLSYPSRAVRTDSFLYINNLAPDRFPAGDPTFVYSVGPFGDVDSSPSKAFITENKDSAAINSFYCSAFLKRAEEELYFLPEDPYQLNNVADQPVHKIRINQLREKVEQWRKQTDDPLYKSDSIPFDAYPYYGNPTTHD